MIHVYPSTSSKTSAMCSSKLSAGLGCSAQAEAGKGLRTGLRMLRRPDIRGGAKGISEQAAKGSAKT